MDENRVADLLEELVAWTKFSARDDLLRFLKATLADPKHLTAYELSDGRPQKEVVDGSGLSQPVVSRLWQEWRRLGILRDRGGKMAHLVRPSDWGLQVAPSGEGGKSANPKKSSPGKGNADG